MNVVIRTEAAQFPEKEYINGIFVAVYIDLFETRDTKTGYPARPPAQAAWLWGLKMGKRKSRLIWSAIKGRW